VALGSGTLTLPANDAVSWKVPTPGLLSFDIRIVNASGWGASVFDNPPAFDVLLINKVTYDIYSSGTGSLSVDNRFFFKRVNWVWRRDLFLDASFAFMGDWYIVLDNSNVWDLDAAGLDPGAPSARPPRQSNLTVQYSVEYVLSTAKSVTQLATPCGTVTLNKAPNPVFSYRLTTGVWEIEFGIDSCATGVVPTELNVTMGPCPVIYYVLDRTNFAVVSANDFQSAAHDPSIQPPPSGARHVLNITSAVGELFFVMYAKSATVSAWYRIDQLGASCGRTPAGTANCTLGTRDCACLGDNSCNRGLRCANATCVACPVGDVDCACRQSFTCNAPDSICTGASLRAGGTCQRCPRGTASCPPRAASLLDAVWDRCDADLKTFAFGNTETCQQCPRGKVGCRCDPGNACSSGSLCNVNVTTCVADPNRTTSRPVVPKTTAPRTEVSRFVVEPVETRGVDPESDAARLTVGSLAFVMVIRSFFF
jgi:hypothetical protein